MDLQTVRELEQGMLARLGKTPAVPVASVPVVEPTPVVVVAPSVTEPKANAPLDGALLLAARGIPVHPLRPKMKAPLLDEWQNKATSDVNQITAWADAYCGCNWGAVAHMQLGCVWFFEVDRADVVKRIKAETGHTIPKTFRVRSREGRGHYYFKQTAASIAMDNIAQGFVKGGDWSARVDSQYVVAPMSIHPDSGRPYEIVSDVEIVDAPQWLIDWCLSQKIEKKSAASLDDKSPIISGSRNTTLTSLAGTMRAKFGWDEDKIKAELMEINEERCQPTLHEDEVATIAGSIGKKPDGLTQRMNEVPLIGGVPAGTQAHQPVEQAVDALSASSILETERADRVTTKRVRWLWDQRIPFGKLSILAGNPDQGKSLITMYIAAQLTTGRPLFGSPKSLPAAEVLLLAGEDDASDTIVPRLQAAGADLSKVHIMKSVILRDGKGKTVSEREAQLDTDIKDIEAFLTSHPEVQLIIIDPLSNYLGRANMNREQEVRQVLIPLKNLTGRTGISVVGVMHLNKSSDASAIHRIGGAVAFTGVARAVWLFVEDPEDPEKAKHLMLRVKGNIARRIGGLEYQILPKGVEVEGSTEYLPVVEWLGETEAVAADILIGGAPVGRPNDKIQSAIEWLKEFLAKGPETRADVKKFSLKAGFPWRTIERAGKQLHVDITPVGQSGKRGVAYFEWALPGTPATEPEDIDFNDVKVATQ